MAAKQAAWAAKKGVVAKNVEAEIPKKKEEVDDGMAIREMASQVARVVHLPRQNGTRSTCGSCI